MYVQKKIPKGFDLVKGIHWAYSHEAIEFDYVRAEQIDNIQYLFQIFDGTCIEKPILHKLKDTVTSFIDSLDPNDSRRKKLLRECQRAYEQSLDPGQWSKISSESIGPGEESIMNDEILETVRKKLRYFTFKRPSPDPMIFEALKNVGLQSEISRYLDELIAEALEDDTSLDNRDALYCIAGWLALMGKTQRAYEVFYSQPPIRIFYKKVPYVVFTRNLVRLSKDLDNQGQIGLFKKYLDVSKHMVCQVKAGQYIVSLARQVNDHLSSNIKQIVFATLVKSGKEIFHKHTRMVTLGEIALIMAAHGFLDEARAIVKQVQIETESIHNQEMRGGILFSLALMFARPENNEAERQLGLKALDILRPLFDNSRIHRSLEKSDSADHIMGSVITDLKGRHVGFKEILEKAIDRHLSHYIQKDSLGDFYPVNYPDDGGLFKNLLDYYILEASVDELKDLYFRLLEYSGIAFAVRYSSIVLKALVKRGEKKWIVSLLKEKYRGAKEETERRWDRFKKMCRIMLDLLEVGEVDKGWQLYNELTAFDLGVHKRKPYATSFDVDTLILLLEKLKEKKQITEVLDVIMKATTNCKILLKVAAVTAKKRMWKRTYDIVENVIRSIQHSLNRRTSVFFGPGMLEYLESIDNVKHTRSLRKFIIEMAALFPLIKLDLNDNYLYFEVKGRIHLACLAKQYLSKKQALAILKTVPGLLPHLKPESTSRSRSSFSVTVAGKLAQWNLVDEVIRVISEIPWQMFRRVAISKVTDAFVANKNRKALKKLVQVSLNDPVALDITLTGLLVLMN